MQLSLFSAPLLFLHQNELPHPLVSAAGGLTVPSMQCTNNLTAQQARSIYSNVQRLENVHLEMLSLMVLKVKEGNVQHPIAEYITQVDQIPKEMGNKISKRLWQNLFAHLLISALCFYRVLVVTVHSYTSSNQKESKLL